MGIASERASNFCHAIAVLAHYRAKKAVQAQIRARGDKRQNYSCKDIALLAEDYMAPHRTRLIEEAANDVARWPEFAAECVRNVTRNRTLLSDGNANHRTNQLSDVAPTTVNRTVPHPQPNAAYRQREYLTEAEVESLAHYLGHRNLQSTARYTALAEGRFAQFWKD